VVFKVLNHCVIDNRIVFVSHVIVQKNGFTLIELISIVVMLGVLATVAIPRLFGSSAFTAYTLRDQLISALQLVQHQAMNAPPYDAVATPQSERQCHWLVIEETCFYRINIPQAQQGCEWPTNEALCHRTKNTEVKNTDVENMPVFFNKGRLQPAHYRFDTEGRIAQTKTATEISIAGKDKLSVVIEEEGYIHGHRQE